MAKIIYGLWKYYCLSPIYRFAYLDPENFLYEPWLRTTGVGYNIANSCYVIVSGIFKVIFVQNKVGWEKIKKGRRRRINPSLLDLECKQ